MLRLLSFSLLGRAKQWFYTNKDNINTWAKCSKAILEKLFLVGKTNALRGNISNFQLQKGETILEAWQRFQEYILDCPHYGMEDWLLIQSFYHGLTQKAHEQLDATAGGSFMSLTLGKAKTLMEKIASNQGFSYAIRVKKYRKRCVQCQPRWTYY